MLVLDYEHIVAQLRATDAYQHVEECLGNNGAGFRCEVDVSSGGEPDMDVARACMEALGPNGKGFIVVKGMRGYASLRCRLLCLAQKLALMTHAQRLDVLKKHGLGTDVPLKSPDRAVSSFAAQLCFGSLSDHSTYELFSSSSLIDMTSQLSSHKDEGENMCDLGSLFTQLGMCMIEVGLRVAQLCDSTGLYSGLREASLEDAIRESCTAKGRLIHYHSLQERAILYSNQKDIKADNQKKNLSEKFQKQRSSTIQRNVTADPREPVSNFWQNWHCDYGIFTVLTDPLFLKPTQGQFSGLAIGDEEGCSSSNGADSNILQCEGNRLVTSGQSPLTATQTTSFWRPMDMADGAQSPEGGMSLTSLQVPATPPSISECFGVNNIESQRGKRPQKHHSERTLLESLDPKEGRRFPLSSQKFAEESFSVQECAPPDGHSSLLVMDVHGRVTSVLVPSDSLIVQVGEAAQLLTGGKLVARAHCVTRPTRDKDVSRETMAVFLQPSWDRPLTLPRGEGQSIAALEAGGISTNMEMHIPPLATRWKEGYTFADFSKETTRQYYGADGRQK